MFYYSWPRTEAAGEYKGGKVVGIAWVDHEYSLGANGVKENPEALSYGWRWFSLLTSGAQAMEITITQVCHSVALTSSAKQSQGYERGRHC